LVVGVGSIVAERLARGDNAEQAPTPTPEPH